MNGKSREQGSITVFLTILFLLFFSMIGVMFEHARILSSSGYVRMAAHSAAMTAFGDYNRELFQEYGLLGYGGFDGIGYEKLEEMLTGILQENLRSSPQDAKSTYSDFYRFQNIKYAVDSTQVLTDSKIFQQQIHAYLKDTAEKEAVEKVLQKIAGTSEQEGMQSKLSMTKDFEDGKYDQPEETKDKSAKKEPAEKDTAKTNAEETNTEKKSTEEKSTSKKNTAKEEGQEALEDDAAGGNPLEMLSEIKKTGVLSFVCDTKKLSDGEVEVCQTDETMQRKENEAEQETKDKGKKQSTEEEEDKKTGAAEYLARILKMSPQTESGSAVKQGIEKIELLCYAKKQFASYGKEQDRTTQYGIEYLIAGKKEEKENLSAVVNRILAIRTLLNFAYVATDSILQSKSLATATALAGFTGMPPVINAVQYTILLILAFEEACVDTSALLDGRSVPLIKDATSFRMKYEEICMVSQSFFASKAKAYPKEADKKGVQEISYQNYLTFFLSLVPDKTIQSRMFDLIQYDLRKKYNETFSIHNCICQGNYSVTYEVPYLFSGLPAITRTGESDCIAKCLEVKYGYKSE
ncbi:MAG: DUF5702 domain-containing protein [Butyribacter sp.]|nr:DUF5702 domain-containing protein [bacterium]MDY3854218.1 DUF5702 domain-containing protein [Butyribacter sp.]